VSVPVLVVVTKPEARRVRARWGDRFPELFEALVLSSFQGWAAAAGLRPSRVYVDGEAYAARGRRYVTLLQTLQGALLRAGGDPVVRLLPRLAENPMVEQHITDVVNGRG
jgi:hypothetical protein